MRLCSRTVIQLFSCLPALVLCGCISSKNISNRQPFSDYVGKTVTLNRPMILLKEGRGFWTGEAVPRVRVSPYVMYDGDKSVEKGAPIKLPAGQQVKITKVCDEIMGDSANIIAYGTVVPPNATNRITFGYQWGMIWQLHPAPWEPEGTPELRRRVGALPSHWNYDIFQPPTNAPTWGEPGVRK